MIPPQAVSQDAVTPPSAGEEDVPMKTIEMRQYLQILSQISILSNRMRIGPIIYTSKLRMTSKALL